LAQVIAIYLVLAQIELEWNNTDRAQVLVNAGLAAQRNDPERTADPALLAIQAELWLARGQVDRARQVITALHADSDLPPSPRLFARRLTVVAAEVDLASGRAQAVLDRLRPLLDRSNTAFELSLCMARAELALGDAVAAETELADVRDHSENPSALAVSWLLTALAADHQRNDHRAMSALDRALAAAEPENIRRPFVALGDRRLEALLKHRLRLSVPGGSADRGFAEGILDELHPVDRVAVILAPLAETLTDREQVVLSHMAMLKTNEQIAAELYISINTVKAHARAVYRKLEVPNRRDAVNRARELGLI
jgi:LuxR family maltose regulon positive regulatory protein